jgi:chemotaxis protein MotB
MNRRKSKAQAKAGAPLWMTSWADMVSLLMCFFVMLFALSNVDEARWQAFADSMAATRFFMGGGGQQASLNDPAGGEGILDFNRSPIPPIIPPADDPEPTPTPTPPPGHEVDPLAQMVEHRRAYTRGMADSFQTYMAQHYADYVFGVVVDDLGFMRITFPNHMLFVSGSDELFPEAIEMVDHLAAWLAEYSGHHIVIQGHTDDRPINTPQFRSNMHLSAGRAISVFNRLVHVHGFDPTYISASGLGEHMPVDTNDTVEGRANNRRVEILIYAPQLELMGQQQRFELMVPGN